MSDAIKTQPVFYTKEFDTYNNSQNNFVANQELTVNITLNEYRDLIEKNATRQKAIEEAKDQYYKAYRENEALKNENSELKSKLVDLGFKTPFTPEEDED